MDTEAQPLGMSINWTKTKIQDLGGCDAPCQRVSVQGNEVEVVESFIYLGSLIHCSGGSELEIQRHAAFVHEAMSAVDQNIWSSSISLETKLYNACILPIFLYGSEVWSVTSLLLKKIDALDNWCLKRILHIHWTEFVSMKRFGLALDNHSSLTLSVDVACLSSGISVVPIPVKTILELFSRAFWVLPETGVAELVDPDNLG